MEHGYEQLGSHPFEGYIKVQLVQIKVQYILERIVESTLSELGWHKSMTIKKRVRKNPLKISPINKHKVDRWVEKIP